MTNLSNLGWGALPQQSKPKPLPSLPCKYCQKPSSDYLVIVYVGTDTNIQKAKLKPIPICEACKEPKRQSSIKKYGAAVLIFASDSPDIERITDKLWGIETIKPICKICKFPALSDLCNQCRQAQRKCACGTEFLDYSKTGPPEVSCATCTSKRITTNMQGYAEQQAARAAGVEKASVDFADKIKQSKKKSIFDS